MFADLVDSGIPKPLKCNSGVEMPVAAMLINITTPAARQIPINKGSYSAPPLVLIHAKDCRHQLSIDVERTGADQMHSCSKMQYQQSR